MLILDSSSLGMTVDNINAVFLSGEVITPAEGLEAARWIVSRQGEKGSYRGLPAPTQTDFAQGMRLFTGERLVSASARHILGQEAARAAWLLGRSDPVIRHAYDQATCWMHEEPDFKQRGTYCCGRCTLAFWRHTWVGNFDNKEAHLSKGLQMMKDLRQGDGKWRTFPFFYTIYTLSGFDLEPAYAELKYARLAMERYLKRPRADVYSQRRVAIITKILKNLN
jgi:hypothetical protein